MGEVLVDIKWQYGDKTGHCVDSFGYPEFNIADLEDLGGLMYWYEEGNGSCDCNRARIIGLEEELPCGETINFLEIKPRVGLLLK